MPSEIISNLQFITTFGRAKFRYLLRIPRTAVLRRRLFLLTSPSLEVAPEPPTPLREHRHSHRQQPFNRRHLALVTLIIYKLRGHQELQIRTASATKDTDAAAAAESLRKFANLSMLVKKLLTPALTIIYSR